MNVMTEDLSGLGIGEVMAHENLSVHPLIRESLLNRDYLTLDEALERGVARVSEVTEGGSVPHLLFRNKADQAVLLLDGEELVGAKQNRVLNITLLAPAGKETVIPVSCVERGRWRYTSTNSQSAPRVHFSEGRARRAEHVSYSLRREDMPSADQGEVWACISDKMGRMQSHSPTDAIERAFEDHESRLSEYVQALACQQGQVGAVFAIEGRVTGLELFDSADTCRLLMPKIVRSYALDAIDPGPGYRSPEATIASPQDILERVRGAAYSTHDSVGEGQDLRFDRTEGIVGGALHARDRLVHLCAFVANEQRASGDGNGYRHSASMRRRFRNVA